MAKLHVKLVKSTIGAIPNHKKIVKALGLNKLQQVALHEDNAMIRGMVAKVKHLVEVTEA